MATLGLKPQSHIAQSLQSDSQLLSHLFNIGYNCFILPITNHIYRQKCKDYFQQCTSSELQLQSQSEFILDTLTVPFPELQDTALFNGNHIQHTIGLISSWIELDSYNSIINEFSFQVLYNEISYANYLGIKTFILTPPKNINNIQIFSSNVSNILSIFPSIHISISLPISLDFNNDSIDLFNIYSTWETWNSIRSICDYNPNLSVALGASNTNIPAAILDRWLLEPIKFYLISSSKFIKNAKNYPVLHKFNQLIIWKLLKYKTLDTPIFILHGIDKSNSPHSNHTSTSLIEYDNKLNKSTYLSYLQHLINISHKETLLPYMYSFTLNALKESKITLSSNPSLILQSPLEPLVNDLENYTYKVFEQDTFKYEQYERAIIKALIDLSKLKTSQNNKKIHILFLGPGRGPLIDRFFSALEFLSLSPSNFKITAIEKNSNVIIYLNQKNSQLWNNNVNIFNMDARNYQNHEDLINNYHQPFDMIISELIGSFGCNELMPECIDSVSSSDLCHENCIFIPQRLNSYISPVYSPHLWKLASKMSVDKLYVPMIPEMEYLTDEPELIWSFTSKVINRGKSSNQIYHLSSNKQNSRQSRVAISPQRKGLIHGLAGFFSSVLYADIEVDNLPKQPGVMDCVSWLPAYLPLETPLNLLEDQEISIFIRRVCLNQSVWYEWSIECFLYTLISKDFGNSPKTPFSTPSPQSNEFLQFSKLPNTSTISHESSIENNQLQFNNTTDGDNISNDDYSLKLKKSITDSNGYFNDTDNCKVKISTGISRIYNLNGKGFKFSLL